MMPVNIFHEQIMNSFLNSIIIWLIQNNNVTNRMESFTWVQKISIELQNHSNK